MLKTKQGLSFAVAAVSVLLLVACGDAVSPQSSDSETSVSTGTMTDSRDGQTYKTVAIGTQTWMAQNLNYETANSYCFGDTPANCTKYGRLYTWEAATTACPEGWHLPTITEFETLFRAVGGQSTAGKVLKSTSGWNDYYGRSGNGTDAFAFSALPAGNRNSNGGYSNEGDGADFWSSTGSNYGFYMYLYYDDDNAYLYYDDGESNGFSVRCLKDDGSTTQSSSSKKVESSSSKVTEPAEVTTGTMTDSRDGQTYKTVTIGTQTWMAQNLNYETANSYCYDDNASYCSKYGRLYTWAAAMDSVGTWSANSKGCGNGKVCSPIYPVQGVCPSGWHLPERAEFETLFTAVGGKSIAGLKLKAQTGWTAYADITNEDAFGFSALPAGYRSYYGSYGNEGDGAYFWSSTENDSNYAYNMILSYDDGKANLNLNGKYNGFSVRCLKD